MSRKHWADEAKAAAWLGLSSLLIWLLTVSPCRADGVTPTNEWINLYSMNSTLNGAPLPEGAIVAVYNSDGTKCGEMVVTKPGWYGTLPCYRDTPSREQGLGSFAAGTGLASSEDVLTFTINGHPASAFARTLNDNPVPPSTSVTWTSMGDLWQVDLQATSGPQVVGGHTVSASPPWQLTWLLGRLVFVGMLIAVRAARAARKCMTVNGDREE